MECGAHALNLLASSLSPLLHRIHTSSKSATGGRAGRRRSPFYLHVIKVGKKMCVCVSYVFFFPSCFARFYSWPAPLPSLPLDPPLLALGCTAASAATLLLKTKTRGPRRTCGEGSSGIQEPAGGGCGTDPLQEDRGEIILKKNNPPEAVGGGGRYCITVRTPVFFFATHHV